MGKPMAANVLKAGYSVVVSDIYGNEAPAAELKALGAQVVPSIREIAQAADIIVSVLPADPQILSVYTDEDGVINHIKDGAVCFEMTSARGDTVKQIAAVAKERGKSLTFVDAPVSGGVPGAQAGTLTIMVGCDKGYFEEAKAFLETMGKKLFYTGELGSGKDIKMLNQLLNAGNTVIASEVVFLARHLGLDLDLLCNVVNESSGGSWVFKNNVPKYILPREFEGGFKLSLMKKDVSLSAAQIANDHLCMPMTNLVYQLYEAMSNQGHDGDTYCVISQWVEQQNKPIDK